MRTRISDRRRSVFAVGIIAFAVCLLTACSGKNTDPKSWTNSDPVGSMELVYAHEFAVDYFEDGSALITIGGTDRYLLIGEDADPPTDPAEDVTVLKKPLDSIYLAASSAMDFFRELDRLDDVRFTSTKRSDWSIPAVTDALDNGALLYAGHYNAPDYELILSEGCDVAIESTMIYHSPDTRERIEDLGIPVMVERSSYESHPLGRMEWIKLYGLLTDTEAEAESFFDSQLASLDGILTGSETEAPPSVAYFSISANSRVNVRKSDDYIAKLIEMAGGNYIFSELLGEDNALSTTNMQMEAFYATAKDADIIIYNSTIEGDISTIGELLDKSELLGDFAAVKNGNGWCTNKNMFQETTGLGELLMELNGIITGEADGGEGLRYLHKVT
jgi:iron complex transport system substrate-binding protein